MRVAIVHYWLLTMRGGEKVVEALCRLLPEADLFTLFCAPDRLSPFLRTRRITTSFLNPARRWYRSLLPLMPMALESFDLRDYDLVISSESGPAKGVIVPSSARHICYCHTPMRYLWDLYPAYLHEWSGGRLTRALLPPLANYLRLWDYAGAARVDQFIANSENVRRRIRRAYRRESEVVYPPVAVESFFWKPPEDYYLIVAELVPYKRIDLAVRLFSRNGRRLRIAGEGPEYRRLRAMAAGNVEFCGRVEEEELHELYARCRALIVPGEEDFGMTAVEAIASGKSLIVLDRGGAPEVARFHGFLFETATEASLEDAIARFEAREADVDRSALQAFAARFSETEFHRSIARILALPDPDASNHLSAGEHF
jgi:glycosyltransferase involved in cell wall biosynthesis